MNIDTNEFRKFYTRASCERTSVNADIDELCDEIDRLRKGLEITEELVEAYRGWVRCLREELRVSKEGNITESALPEPDKFGEWSKTVEWDHEDYKTRARFTWNACKEAYGIKN